MGLSRIPTMSPGGLGIPSGTRSRTNEDSFLFRIFKLRVVSYKQDLAWRIDDAWKRRKPEHGVIQIIADYVVGEGISSKTFHFHKNFNSLDNDPMKLQLVMDLEQLERSLDQHLMIVRSLAESVENFETRR